MHTYTEKKIAAKNSITALRAEYGNASAPRREEIVAEITDLCIAFNIRFPPNGGC